MFFFGKHELQKLGFPDLMMGVGSYLMATTLSPGRKTLFKPAHKQTMACVSVECTEGGGGGWVALCQLKAQSNDQHQYKGLCQTGNALMWSRKAAGWGPGLSTIPHPS